MLIALGQSKPQTGRMQWLQVQSRGQNASPDHIEISLWAYRLGVPSLVLPTWAIFTCKMKSLLSFSKISMLCSQKNSISMIFKQENMFMEQLQSVLNHSWTWELTCYTWTQQLIIQHCMQHRPGSFYNFSISTAVATSKLQSNSWIQRLFLHQVGKRGQQQHHRREEPRIGESWRCKPFHSILNRLKSLHYAHEEPKQLCSPFIILLLPVLFPRRQKVVSANHDLHDLHHSSSRFRTTHHTDRLLFKAFLVLQSKLLRHEWCRAWLSSSTTLTNCSLFHLN